MKEIYERLYSKLQCTESYNMAFFDSDKIYVPCGFNKVVSENLKYVIEVNQRRIDDQLVSYNSRLRIMKTIDAIRKSGSIKEIASLDISKAIAFISKKYGLTEKEAKDVLQKPISYLTKEHVSEIKDIENTIKSLEKDKRDIYEFLIGKYNAIRKELSGMLDFKPTCFV